MIEVVSKFHIGKATLMVPDHGGRELQVTDFGGETHDAWEMPAVVAAPRGLLREIAYELKSFDLYREHLSGVRLVTYDEILEQLKTLRAFLASVDE